MLQTRFTKLLGCSVPLQQAGMGGIAMPSLVRAVANAGGLGMLGGALLPPPVLGEMLDGLAGETRGMFGVNFLVPFLDQAAVAVAATRARVAASAPREPWRRRSRQARMPSASAPASPPPPRRMRTLNTWQRSSVLDRRIRC
jgi:NAD(P)H-dependent flavin oxidoreductase YrpB (nitropropane dioxygenase family)